MLIRTSQVGRPGNHRFGGPTTTRRAPGNRRCGRPGTQQMDTIINQRPTTPRPASLIRRVGLR
jgi:hypothetical protein